MKDNYVRVLAQPELMPYSTQEKEAVMLLYQDLIKQNIPIRRMMFNSGVFVKETELNNFFHRNPGHPSYRVIRNEIVYQTLIA